MKTDTRERLTITAGLAFSIACFVGIALWAPGMAVAPHWPLWLLCGPLSALCAVGIYGVWRW